MNTILKQLSGGDLRSEGDSDEVAGQIITQPSLLPQLAAGLSSTDKLIRARTCMSMEIISRQYPQLLEPVRSALIELAITENIPQARWHLAEIFANITISSADAERIIPVLISYLEDKSKIVKYCSIQALGILGAGSIHKETIIQHIAAHKDDSKSMSKVVAQALNNLT